MELTEEQRKRSEANRLAALAKRKRAPDIAVNQDVWKLFKCRKIPNQTPEIESILEKISDCFRVVLEICAPDEFSVTPEPIHGSPFPCDFECSRKIDTLISSVVPCRYAETQTGVRASVYKLKDHDTVLKCLKNIPRIQLEEIPWKTLAVVQKFSYSFIAGRWKPCLPYLLLDDEVDGLLGRLPKMLREALLPFQLDGVKFGLRRGGRCLIADEMGLGKTIQAIAIACCFMNEGPILIVCPAILRFSWAEELEHWLPSCLPMDIHLVFGHRDNLVNLTSCPRIVVISYTMLHRLQKSMLEQEWALMIVDESHNIRCTKKSESEETKSVLEVASKIKRIILLSGTPSLSRPYDIFHQINILWPGLLGKDKYEFARNYCSLKIVQGFQGKTFKDFSKGVRLEELNILLRQTMMIRRLKEHVMVQLPPKRRQVIRMMLTRADIMSARAASGMGVTVCNVDGVRSGSVMNRCSLENGGDDTFETFFEGPSMLSPSKKKGTDGYHISSSELSYQERGIAKLSGFREWLSNHPVGAESEEANVPDVGLNSQKMLIFGHHLKVLDGIQEIACAKGIEFVRIDGSTLPRDRQAAVQAFRLTKKIKIAIIGITAGGVGLDFSSAQNVVFLELPKSASEMLQAEDRAHRRGQSSAVNIYVFCAKDTCDEEHWGQLNRSLYRVSSMLNGENNAIEEIKVDTVCNLGLVMDAAKYETEGENAPEDMKICGLGPVSISKSEVTDKKELDLDPANSQNIATSWKNRTGGIHTETSEKGEGEFCLQIKDDASSSIPVKPFQCEVDKDIALDLGDSVQSSNSRGDSSDDIKLEASSQVFTSKFCEDIGRNEILDGIISDYLPFANVELLTSKDVTVRIQTVEKQNKASEKCDSVATVDIKADANASLSKDSKCLQGDKVCDQAIEDTDVGTSCPVSSIKFDQGSGEYELLDSKNSDEMLLSDVEAKKSNFINLKMSAEDMLPVTFEEGEGKVNELIEADANSSIPPDSLRFEVSQYTGRVHLYACVRGKDSRPWPLGENFRPEELESWISSATNMKTEAVPKFIHKNPAYHDVLHEFMEEWNKLRPIERNKLLGKPLQLPLDIELHYLKETANHGCGGLLKGGSKRRVTPVDDISYSLPENASWRKVSLRSGNAKKQKEYTQAWTVMEQPLCKLCQKPCSGKGAKAPEFFEDLFCDLSCFEEYRIRTSQRALREGLFHIEHGVCHQCKLDCHKLVQHIKPLSVSNRRLYIAKVAPEVAKQKSLIDKLVHEPIEGNAWHADHILPVYKGGGECKLENMRTLCVACHAVVTTAQRAERCEATRRAKEQIKIMMKKLKDGNVEQTFSQLVGRTSEEKEKDIEEDDLLIVVPGSAYSSGENKRTDFLTGELKRDQIVEIN